MTTNEFPLLDQTPRVEPIEEVFGRQVRGLSKEFMGEAACKEHPEIDFLKTTKINLRIAQKICLEECPVRADCETYGRESNARAGIWGGIHYDELGKKD